MLDHLNLNATQIYARFDIEGARRALEANAETLPLSLLAVAVPKSAIVLVAASFGHL